MSRRRSTTASSVTSHSWILASTHLRTSLSAQFSTEKRAKKNKKMGAKTNNVPAGIVAEELDKTFHDARVVVLHFGEGADGLGADGRVAIAHAEEESALEFLPEIVTEGGKKVRWA